MRTLAAAAFSALLLAGGAAAAQTDPGVNTRPDATINLSAKAIAVGVGYSWGDGILAFHGHHYHFSVKGLDVADVGFARISGHGRVYHLHNVQDFSGTYAAATGEATVGTGIGGQILRNGNGVMIRVDQVTKGARLEGSAGGIQLTLNP